MRLALTLLVLPLVAALAAPARAEGPAARPPASDSTPALPPPPPAGAIKDGRLNPLSNDAMMLGGDFTALEAVMGPAG